ncbi:MAG: tail-specific protease, partial [Calditrichaeota bacterium]
MRLNYDPRRVMRALFSSTLLFILSFGFSLNASGEALHPDRKQVISSQVIANLLRQYHYNHQRINDRVSSEWLDLYLDRLDRHRLYFLASDIAQFEKYRYLLDDYIRSGNMDPPFLIFNTFKVRLSQRVNFVQKQLDRGFDFSIDETYQIDRSKEPWVESVRELDEIWRKKLKNEALNLKLSGRDWAAVQKNLRKRYTNFQKRIEQYNTEDVFQLFMNALAETFDPHTSYFSPITSENFGIDMSLSFEGIGAQLTTEDDYTKVVRILPGGPADRSKQLWANDKIVGVAQGEHGEMVDVIGMRLDDVVQKIRGPKGTVVRLEVIPAGSPAGSPTKEISLVRDKVILEERAAKSDTIELVHQGRKYKIGVIDVPAFYVDL